jgi:hypothetical protein
MEQRKCICFAYYGNGKFLGWYSDTFGTITPNSPKIYENSERQLEIIKTNFSHKIKSSKDGSDDFLGGVARALFNTQRVDEGVTSMMATQSLVEKTKIQEYQNMELRIVECPYYSGPNPDFDEEEYNRKRKEEKEKMTSFGVFDVPGPSKERFDIVEKFHDIFGNIECNSWIYADYSEVKEWAKNEPTKFIGTINSN